MEGLHALLTWRHEADLLDRCVALRARYQGSIAAALAAALARIARDGHDGAGRCARLRDTVDTLAPGALTKILEAPETCFQLVKRRDQEPARLVRFLERAIGLERAAQREAVCFSGPAWSVLGDRYVPGPSSDSLETDLERYGWLGDPSQPYRALDRDGIVIDFFSPYAARPLAQNNFRPDFAPPIPYTNEQAATVAPRIVAAFEAIESIGGAGIGFVRAMIRTIMPRPDAASGLFSGSSNRGHMGRVNLFNPHLDYISHHNVANSLIHESIHIMLYLIEQGGRPVEDNDVLYNDFVESPWSGRPIHLLAYIHASFVWYGLYHFWSLPEVAKQMDGLVRQHYLNFIVRGFERGEMLARLVRFEPYIRADLMEELVMLQKTMAK